MNIKTRSRNDISGSLVKGTLAPSPLFSGHVISLSKLMCCSKCLQRAIHQSDRPPTESTDSSQGGLQKEMFQHFATKKEKKRKGTSKKLNIAQSYMYLHSYFATLHGEK